MYLRHCRACLANEGAFSWCAFQMDMDRLAFARVLHVLAVVVWIGGLSIVTTTLLPAIRRGEFGAD